MSEQTPPPKRQPPKNGKPFVKGDPRINRRGRPKTFDMLRKEAIKLACEVIENSATGEQISVANAILRSWAVSGDVNAQRLFIEYAFGKVPNKEEITGAGGNELTVRYVNDWRNPTTNTARRTKGGDEGGEAL